MRLTVLIALALSAPLHAGTPLGGPIGPGTVPRTLVVAQEGGRGAGADFGQIGDAVAAAVGGQLILVRPGTYAPFEVTGDAAGKGLSIFADGAVRVAGDVHVTQLADRETVVLAGLEVAGDVVLRDAAGTVFLQDVGTDGAWIADGVGTLVGSGARAAELTLNESFAALYDTRIAGDVALRSSTLFASGSSFAHSEQDGASRLMHQDTAFLGARASEGAPRARVEFVPGSARPVTDGGPVEAWGDLELTYGGEALDTVHLTVSTHVAPGLVDGVPGVLVPERPASFPLGSLPIAGERTDVFPLSQISVDVGGLVLFVQTWHVNLLTLDRALGPPRAIAVVPPGI